MKNKITSILFGALFVCALVPMKSEATEIPFQELFDMNGVDVSFETVCSGIDASYEKYYEPKIPIKEIKTAQESGKKEKPQKINCSLSKNVLPEENRDLYRVFPKANNGMRFIPDSSSVPVPFFLDMRNSIMLDLSLFLKPEDIGKNVDIEYYITDTSKNRKGALAYLEYGVSGTGYEALIHVLQDNLVLKDSRFLFNKDFSSFSGYTDSFYPSGYYLAGDFLDEGLRGAKFSDKSNISIPINSTNISVSVPLFFKPKGSQLITEDDFFKELGLSKLNAKISVDGKVIFDDLVSSKARSRVVSKELTDKYHYYLSSTNYNNQTNLISKLYNDPFHELTTPEKNWFKHYNDDIEMFNKIRGDKHSGMQNVTGLIESNGFAGGINSNSNSDFSIQDVDFGTLKIGQPIKPVNKDDMITVRDWTGGNGWTLKAKIQQKDESIQFGLKFNNKQIDLSEDFATVLTGKSQLKPESFSGEYNAKWGTHPKTKMVNSIINWELSPKVSQ